MNRIKQMLINWGSAYVLITALLYLLNGWLSDYPIYLRTFILSGLMVFAMQYLLAPIIFKLTNQKS